MNNSGSCFCFVLFCFVFFSFFFFFLFFLGVDFSRSTNSLIFFLEFIFSEPIIVSEIALGSSKVGVFSSVVVGAVMYEED